MTKPIADKAEVALDCPDKFYNGTFERSSRISCGAVAVVSARHYSYLVLQRTSRNEP